MPAPHTHSAQNGPGPAPTAPGARGRIGVIQPAPGLMLEAEWMTAMPPGVAFPVTRLALMGTTRAHYAVMAEQAPQAAAILANAGAEIIAYACGIGSLAEGPAAERALMDRLQTAAGGIRTIGMAEAAALRMRARQARRITLLTPFAPDINALVQTYLDASGFTVAAIARLPVASAIAAAGLGGAEIMAAARAAVAMASTDLLWIPCSNVRSIALIGEIEAATSCPCLSSNQALLEVALAHLGLTG